MILRIHPGWRGMLVDGGRWEAAQTRHNLGYISCEDIQERYLGLSNNGLSAFHERL